MTVKLYGSHWLCKEVNQCCESRTGHGAVTTFTLLSIKMRPVQFRTTCSPRVWFLGQVGCVHDPHKSCTTCFFFQTLFFQCFSRMHTERFSFNLGGLGVEECSLFAQSYVWPRNRPRQSVWGPFVCTSGEFRAVLQQLCLAEFRFLSFIVRTFAFRVAGATL